MDEITKRFRKAKSKNVVEALRLCHCTKASEDEFYCAKSCCPFAFPDKERLAKGLYVCLKYELKQYIFELEESIKSIEWRKNRKERKNRRKNG